MLFEIESSPDCSAEDVPLPLQTSVHERIPDGRAVAGKLVALERLIAEGVPRFGVVSVGLVARTTLPEPVEDAATAREGVVVLFVTVGTSQEGQLPEGAEKDVTVPLPPVELGATNTYQLVPSVVTEAVVPLAIAHVVVLVVVPFSVQLKLLPNEAVTVPVLLF